MLKAIIFLPFLLGPIQCVAALTYCTSAVTLLPFEVYCMCFCSLAKARTSMILRHNNKAIFFLTVCSFSDFIYTYGYSLFPRIIKKNQFTQCSKTAWEGCQKHVIEIESPPEIHVTMLKLSFFPYLHT